MDALRPVDHLRHAQVDHDTRQRERVLPLQAMLPSDGAQIADGAGFAVDLARLESSTAQEAKVIARFVKRLQAQRQDWVGTVFRMRSSDTVALASALDRTPLDVLKLIAELGVGAH